MSIKNLDIQNFRGFRHFQMTDLGRVNLLVGTNNCGKTTVLEAVNILMGGGNLAAIWSILNTRGRSSGSKSMTHRMPYRSTTKWDDSSVTMRSPSAHRSSSPQRTDVGRIELIARIEDFPPTQSQPSQLTFPGIETSAEFSPFPRSFAVLVERWGTDIPRSHRSTRRRLGF